MQRLTFNYVSSALPSVVDTDDKRNICEIFPAKNIHDSKTPTSTPKAKL